MKVASVARTELRSNRPHRDVHIARRDVARARGLAPQIARQRPLRRREKLLRSVHLQVGRALRPRFRQLPY
jgi:hypothetical protein